MPYPTPTFFSRGACLLAFVVLLAAALGSPARAQQAVVSVENPRSAAAEDEVVTVPWADVRGVLGEVAADGPVRVSAAAGGEVAAQVFDEDGDGEPDALLFLVDLRPGEQRRYMVEAAAPSEPPAPRAHAFHQEERDDVAWENERVAFRTYGEGLSALEDLVSSGIDVWMKRVPKLVIDAWYADGHYHTDTGEGADFFSVGSTLGGGGTGVWRDGQLYPAPNFGDYRIVADGPLRAVLDLTYGPWDAGGLSVTERKRITIDAGTHFFRSESMFEADGADTLTYAAGLVKRDGAVGSSRRMQPWSWLSLWGPVASGGGGHGDLGTAVVVDEERLVGMEETDTHYLALVRAASGEPVTHYVGAGWTATEAFGGVEDWWAAVGDYARTLEEPLRVQVTSGE